MCNNIYLLITEAEELSRHVMTCPETAPVGGPGDTSLKRRHERVADMLRRLENLGGVEVRKEPVAGCVRAHWGERFVK